MTDIITRYCDLMAQITDAHRDFQESCGLYIVSTFAQAKFQFLSLPELRFTRDSDAQLGTSLLNLWFILLGLSRITRKTKTISKAVDAINDIAPELQFTDDFTPEVVIKMFDNKKDCIMSWIQDECLQFFETLKHKDYMRGVDSLLSSVYDGRGRTKQRVGSGKQGIPPGSSINILLGSTPYLPHVLEESQFRQGFLNRFIFVYPPIPTWKAKIDRLPTLEQKQELTEILDWFAALYDYSPGKNTRLAILYFEKDAHDLLVEYDRSVSERIRASNSESLKTGWLGNAPNVAERLAAIYRIARLTKADLGKSMVDLQVNKQDIDRSLAFMKKAEVWFDKVVQEMETSGIDKDIKNLIECISIKGTPDPITGRMEVQHSVVMPYMHAKKREVREIIDTAIDRGLIEQLERGQGKSKSIFYRLA